MNCQYCKLPPKYDVQTFPLVPGFIDTDMNVFVCPNCKTEHYQHKSDQGMKGLYSETPAVVTKDQFIAARRAELDQLMDWLRDHPDANIEAVREVRHKLEIVTTDLEILNRYNNDKHQ